MELARQVGEGDGAASTGKAWVSRRPESGGIESGGGETGGIGEKIIHFLYQPFLPISRTKMEDLLRSIRACFSRNFKSANKLLVG